MLVVFSTVDLRSTNQEYKLLFDADRDLHDKGKWNDKHKDVRRDVEGSLYNCVVVQYHTVQWRRRSNLPIQREWSALKEIGKLTSDVAYCDVDSKNFDRYLLLEAHSAYGQYRRQVVRFRAHLRETTV